MGIALNLIYLLNIFSNFSYIKEFSFWALNNSFKHIPGIKSQLTAFSLAASLNEFITSSFVIVKLLLLFGLI